MDNINSDPLEMEVEPFKPYLHTGDSDSSMTATSDDDSDDGLDIPDEFMSEDLFNLDEMLKIPVVIDLTEDLVKSITRTSDIVVKAVDYLLKGEILALPTDTTYGIICDSQNSDAVNRVLSIKGCDQKKHLSICVGRIRDIDRWGSTAALSPRLLEALLPGKVNIILKKRPALNRSINPYTDTIGVRMPDNRFLQTLAVALGRPLVLATANVKDDPRPISVEELYPIWQFVGAVYDGGKLTNRDGATTVDLSYSGQYTMKKEGENHYAVCAVMVKSGLYRFKLSRLKDVIMQK